MKGVKGVPDIKESSSWREKLIKGEYGSTQRTREQQHDENLCEY